MFVVSLCSINMEVNSDDSLSLSERNEVSVFEIYFLVVENKLDAISYLFLMLPLNLFQGL